MAIIYITLQFKQSNAGDSRNKTMPAEVVVVANSKQIVFSWTQLVVKYTPKNFGYDYTLYCKQHRNYTEVQRRLNLTDFDCIPPVAFFKPLQILYFKIDILRA